MPEQSINIVTFNANERDAIDFLLKDMCGNGSAWRPKHDNPRSISRTNPKWRVTHEPLEAQGNVMAATQTAKLFNPRNRPDMVIFYGCAGSNDTALVGHVFFVGTVAYASLGTVDDEIEPAAERLRELVTLKRKWLDETMMGGVTPLVVHVFETGSDTSSRGLPATTGIDVAHVIATDKVVKVAAVLATPKPPKEWTYSHALAWMATQSKYPAVLIEMESYGIAAIAEALEIKERVLVIRVVTDCLVDKTTSTSDESQRELLIDGRQAVAIVLDEIISRTGEG
ncbi:hypothetical protein KBY66_03390 [Synechococcus sp. Tobar12-5m-g]|uniref:hypothetical protein n=1 Tax=unclassified Synechococcus TaxID=2626047 RepID=UPI0020CF1C6C|nr:MULTISPECIES: hypothetical protein [unclassified Synechococcus]MCP9771670.1 hypothetical protein [Synechococcus sp. Tobar12-5m-g]MCP9872611.1 hypothetical protein [Synechococcus sp. Cruz CV-v-12]